MKQKYIFLNGKYTILELLKVIAIEQEKDHCKLLKNKKLIKQLMQAKQI